MLSKEDIKGGILPATPVPLDENYDVRSEDLKKLLEKLNKIDGVLAVVCNAELGEGHQLPVEKKVEVLKLHKKFSKVPVVAGVWSTTTQGLIEDAQRAEEAGADAVMPRLPFDIGDPESSTRVVVNLYKELADSINIPIIAFNPLGGPRLSIDALVEVCKMEEVIALKEASFDPVFFEEVVRRLEPIREEITLLTGNDTFIAPSYLLGAESGLLGYTVLFTEAHVRKLRAVQEGDVKNAMEIRKKMLPLTHALFKKPYRDATARIKYALVLDGTYESDVVVPPKPTLSQEEKEEIKRAFEQVSKALKEDI